MENDMALEVSWVRRLLEDVEKDYTGMVDSLLAENKQLEDLLSLMAHHLDNLASNYPGKELEGPDAAAAAGKITAQLSQRLEELQREALQAREAQQDRVSLQKRLCEEEMGSKQLQRRLEAMLQENGAAPFEESEIDDEMGRAALIAKVRGAEKARAQEARSRELAETRCALVERRCRDAVARLEAELAEARSQSAVTWPKDKPMDIQSDGPARSPLKEEVQAFTQQMEMERKVHDHRRSLLERYSLPDKVPAMPSQTRPVTETPRSVMITDDEDYGMEGYLERPVDGSYEKVFVDIRDGQFRVKSNKSSPSTLSESSLISLNGPACLTSRCARSFEVAWPDKTERFRCVSERRAEQWVEVGSRSCRGPTEFVLVMPATRPLDRPGHAQRSRDSHLMFT
ncbi:unnamed protein product [Effrenium voratum]|nr:unnamed protein product [Effrenium voratum]